MRYPYGDQTIQKFLKPNDGVKKGVVSGDYLHPT
jgi:hypothetical protein